jgi:phosphoglycolate phosphatase-like HAD superfamily hydrolase
VNDRHDRGRHIRRYPGSTLEHVPRTPRNWYWRADPVAPGPSVIFDVDGVLADASGRQHLLEWPQRDWDAFFEACGDDPVIDEVARMLSLLDDGLVVVLLTARPMRVQRQTVEWIRRHGLRWDLLVMRSEGDRDWASEYKRHVVGDLRAAGYEPQFAVEDDRRNVDMFHRAGIPCLYVHSGYYD